MKKCYRTTAVFLLMTASQLGFAGQQGSTFQAKLFLAIWPAVCKPLVEKSLSDPNLAPILAGKPETSDQVCACVEEKIKAAHDLEARANSFDAHQAGIAPPELYFTGKATAFVLACDAIAIERAAETLVPAEAAATSRDSIHGE